MENRESGNGNGIGTVTRLMKTENILMVLLTKLDTRDQFTSVWFLPLVPFFQREMEHTWSYSWKVTNKDIISYRFPSLIYSLERCYHYSKHTFVFRSRQRDESINWNVTEYALKFELVMPWILAWPFTWFLSTSKYCFALSMHFAFKCILTLPDSEC